MGMIINHNILKMFVHFGNFLYRLSFWENYLVCGLTYYILKKEMEIQYVPSSSFSCTSIRSHVPCCITVSTLLEIRVIVFFVSFNFCSTQLTKEYVHSIKESYFVSVNAEFSKSSDGNEQSS
jgi:hypothetical protein